jgi:hypothetical protein
MNYNNDHALAQNIALEFLRKVDQGQIVPRQIALDSVPGLRTAQNTLALCQYARCGSRCQTILELMFATDMFDHTDLHRYYEAQLACVGLNQSPRGGKKA